MDKDQFLDILAEELKTKGVEEDELHAQLDLHSKALDSGWNPKGPKSADEWVRNAPIHEELKRRGRDLKDAHGTIDKLSEQVEKLTSYMHEQRRMGYEQALQDLQRAKREAVMDGDVDAVEQYETRIDELKAAHSTTHAEPNDLSQHPAIRAFDEKYASVYNDHSFEGQQIKQFLAERASYLQQQVAMGKLGVEDAVEIVESELLKRHADYFDPQPEVATVSRTSTVRPSKGGPKALTLADVPEDVRTVAKQFEAMGIMSVDDYLKDLQKKGVL